MKLQENKIRKIIIFRALQLGDLLCSVPAFRALRAQYPNAHIAIAGMPWMKMFVQRFSSYIDEFIWFPGYPGLPEQAVDPAATIRFLETVNNNHYDLALQMQGNGSIVNPLVTLFGTKYTAGFRTEKNYCPDSDLFMLYPEKISEIHRHLRLMEFLGIPAQGDDLEFPLTRQDEEDLMEASLEVEPGKYICIHPGSRGAARRWPPEYFASIADECRRLGWQIVITGTNEEMPIVEEVKSRMQTEPVVAAGRTNLGALGVLIQNAGGLVSNCTGVSHVAAALKTKSVVISMDGEPERWAPLNKRIHTTVDWTRQKDYSLVRKLVNEQFSEAI